MPWDAFRFASSAVRESVTSSTREGAGLPFADRQRAVRLWPASAHVTTAGSAAAAACGGWEAGSGISRGRPGTGVAIKSSNPRVRGADRRLTFAAVFGDALGFGPSFRTVVRSRNALEVAGTAIRRTFSGYRRALAAIRHPARAATSRAGAPCYCVMRLRTMSLTALPSKRPATLAVTGFITAPSWRMVSSVPSAVRELTTSSTIASTSAAVSAFGR